MIKKVIVMFNSQFKWKLLYKDDVNHENEILDILFKNRNLTNDLEKSRFLSDELVLHDPFLFNHMEKVVNRLKEAIKNQEKVMIYGDFDVDGVTGVSILYKTLKKLNANVYYYIPSRFNEGYGPNINTFKKFVEHGFKIIITVDNGITGIEEANYLKSQGVDFIITDHHEPKEIIPDAYAILHANLKGEQYPFKELAGCGVSFKLAHALLGEAPYDLIDLACLGTYSDMVSLRGENRSIVKWGIKQLGHTAHLGLRLLRQSANIKTVDEYSLGFIYGPRLNAPGRMDNGNVSVRLLVTEDFEEAKGLVSDIENLNQNRKAKIEDIVYEAMDEIKKQNLQQFNVIVVSKAGWHEGVLGIICNRLVDIYHKPVVVLTKSNGVYKGSSRTLEDFPLHENLMKCEDLLEKYGGHKMAAGLTIKEENITPFRQRLHALATGELYNYLRIDSKLNETFINLNLTNELQKLRPYGVSNQKPLFLLEGFEVIQCMQIGQQNKHLKLLIQKNNLFLEAIAFNMGDLFYNINNHDLLDVVGTFEINTYQNTVTNQIMIEDMRCHHKQVFDYRNKPFDEKVLNKEFLYLYFDKDYGYQDSQLFSPHLELTKDIVIIDIPKSMDDLNMILNHPNVENIYFILKCEDIFSYEDLITREKLARIYTVYRRFKQFKRHDITVFNQLEKMGFNKKLQNLSLQVFFELNFVIIENNKIIVVENPEKRQLTESKTYQQVIEQVKMKEELVLSSHIEFMNKVKKIIDGG